jgi:hypothetical protein
LINRGVVPWITGSGHALVLEGDAERLGLPARWDYVGEPLVFGDRRTIRIRGVTVAPSGPATIKLSFLTSRRGRVAFSQTAELK